MTADRYVHTAVFWLVLEAGLLGAVAASYPTAAKVFFREAGFSISPDGGYVFHQGGQLVGSHCVIDFRMTAQGEAGNFKEAVAKQVAFRKKLSETIKESQYHHVIKNETFISASGIPGVRCVFGIHIDQVFSLSYYFVNRSGDFVEIRVRFLSDTRQEGWAGVDRMIMNTLALQ